MTYSPPPGRPQSCPPMTSEPVGWKMFEPTLELTQIAPPVASSRPVRMPGESKSAYGGRVSVWAQKQDPEKYRKIRIAAAKLGQKRKRERQRRIALAEAGKVAVPSETHRWYTYADLADILGWHKSHCEELVRDWPRRHRKRTGQHGQPFIELFGDITTLPTKRKPPEPAAPVVAVEPAPLPAVVPPPPLPFWKRLLGWFS